MTAQSPYKPIPDETENKRIDYLDGWRGLAIIFVLLGHFTLLDEVFFIGRFGVDVFFVLSGLLMSNILFVRRTALSLFYKRRISRIFPAFFLYVTIIYCIDWIFIKSLEGDNYLFSLTFLRTYFPFGTDIWAAELPIDHLWSLNIEEHAYIFLSLLTLFLVNRNLISLILIFFSTLCVLNHYLYYKGYLPTPVNINARTEVAATPLLASAGYFLIAHKFKNHIRSWMPIAAFLLAASGYTVIKLHWTASWSLTPFLLAFCVNHIEEFPDKVKSFLTNKLLIKFGIFSYSIYLWQQPFYKFLEGLKFNSYILSILGIVLCLTAILISLASFHFIENPSRKFLNKRWTSL